MLYCHIAWFWNFIVMKKIVVCLLLMLSLKANSQDLKLRLNLFYAVISNTSGLETSYKFKVVDFISPVSKLNRDSIASDYFSYWDAQYHVNNKFKNFKIDKIEFNNDSTKAIVIIDQTWLLDALGEYIYKVKSEWIKYNGNWYLSDMPSKNIGIRPYYEDNEK